MPVRFAPQQGLHANISQHVHQCRRPRARRCNTVRQAHHVDEGTAEQVGQLLAENKALRLALSKLQGVQPQEVIFDVEAVAALEPVQQADADAPEDSARLEAGIAWPVPGESPPFWERPARTAPLQRGQRANGVGAVRDARRLHVVHMTAEMAPIAKVGGLGDVVTGLARACLLRGHTVEVMLPFYECLPKDQLEGLQHDCEFDCPKGRVTDGQMRTEGLRTLAFRAKIDGVPVVLLRPDWGAGNLFRGSRIYGGSYNELEAYLYFSRACLEYLSASGRKPDIIHVHEWQLSAVPMLYWDSFHAAGLSKARVMLTIHNMDNSGECRQEEFAHTGLPGELFASVDKALDERTVGHNPERLCLMKGGIVYSNAVTTVSPTYAREALDGGAAGWLRSTLARPEVRAKFQGVLNGIDTALWDPAVDHFLPAPYSAADPSGKALCKRYLQKGLGLEVDACKPVVACVTRLVPQKGIHLIRHAVYRTLELGGQFVLLGSGHADGDFRRMASEEFRGSPATALLVMYSEAAAHLIYAAADVVLVPSLFEPCGLTQLIALRYGALPVVRATGGLADTVHDVAKGGEDANGYTFTGVDEGSLNSALDRALTAFREQPQWWADLTQRNMLVDCSWERAAGAYVDIYNRLAAL
ncbi:hypothetical protein WJX81_005900 [Elliptochloris bilobata]|uniref:starch synthase n=1 Tax=Elliptochloris bilobata TaxID=381761 RepID=A0AAW1SLZ0_9CHLO